METNRQEVTQQMASAKAAEVFENRQRHSEALKKKRHNSATYAASLWHSSVKHAHPQNHKGIDL